MTTAATSRTITRTGQRQHTLSSPVRSTISIMDLLYTSPPSPSSLSSSLSPTTLTTTPTPPPSPSTSISSLSPLYYPSTFSSPAFPPLINRRLITKSPDSADTLYTLQAVLVAFYLLIFLSAISGNCLVILTLVQNKRLRTVTNVFLFNLAISDLLLAVFCMPFTLVPFLLRNFIFGTAMCVMIRYLQGVSVSVSCFTLVAMSLERYFAICHPLYSRQWQTLSHAYKTIAACWLLAFAVVIPIATYTKLVSTWNGQIHFCREIWPTKLGSQLYTVFLDWILLIVPILIMSCSYGLIVRTLWLGIKMDEKIQKDAEKSKKKEKESVKMIVCNETTKINQGGDLKKYAKKYTENNARQDGADRKQMSKRNFKRKCNQSVTPKHNSNLNSSSSCSQQQKRRRLTVGGGVRQSNMEKSVTIKKRVIKMLCVIVLEFFICWSPLFCVQTWKAFDPLGIRRHVTAVGINSIYLLAYLSSCCNPITYCFMNKSFRKAFLATFHCVTKRLPGRKNQQRHRDQQLQLLQLEMQDRQQQQQQQQQEKDQQLQQKQQQQQYKEQEQQQQQQRHLLEQHCHLEKQDLESEVSSDTTKFELENTSTEIDTVDIFNNDDNGDDDDNYDDDDDANTYSSDSENFSKQSD